MRVVGVLLVGAGVYLMWYAYESHKSQTPPTPLTNVKNVLTGQAGLTQPAVTNTATESAIATAAAAGA